MKDALTAELTDLVSTFPGRVCIAARDLKSRRVVRVRAGERCPTASVIKLPILVHTLLCVEEGTLDLKQPVVLKAEDKTPGSGILTQLEPGVTLPLLDVLRLMTVLSDNTATNQVIDLVGVEPVNRRMHALGLTKTALHRKVYAQGDPVSESNRKYGLGVTSPEDQMVLLIKLHRHKIGTNETCDLALSILAKQQYRNCIPRWLPSGVKFLGKSGAVDRVRNDVGIVTLQNGAEVAIAVFCKEIEPILWTEENPGVKAIGEIARRIVRHWHPDVELPASGWEPE